MTAPDAKVEAARQAAAPERDRFMTDAETTGAGLPKRRARRILRLPARRPTAGMARWCMIRNLGGGMPVASVLVPSIMAALA